MIWRSLEKIVTTSCTLWRSHEWCQRQTTRAIAPRTETGHTAKQCLNGPDTNSSRVCQVPIDGQGLKAVVVPSRLRRASHVCCRRGEILERRRADSRGTRLPTQSINLSQQRDSLYVTVDRTVATEAPKSLNHLHCATRIYQIEVLQSLGSASGSIICE